MSKTIPFIFIALFVFHTTHAQSWQWAIHGGSSESTTSVGHQPDENIRDMATDQHGNIYILTDVMEAGLRVDGHPMTGFGGHDILISSFKCDGTFRWSKDIGSNSSDLCVSLKADTMGGIYVAGFSNIYFTTLNVSTDTVVVGSSANKSILLMKFDTAGNYKWLKMPQPDTASIFAATTHAMDLDVDGAGNVFLMCALPPGAYANGGYVASTKGIHILRYDRYGNFVSGTRLQMDYNTIALGGLRMSRNHANGKYIVTGDVNTTGGLLMGTTPINSSIFAGCFNSAGTLLWTRQNTHNTGNPTSRAVLDGSHNIYIASISTGLDTFGSYYMSSGGIPVMAKLDTNGNNIWVKSGITNAATFCKNITLNGNEAVIAGQYPSKLKWAGYADSLNHAVSGTGYDIFITRFNAATGAVTGMDSIASDFGVNEYATAITSDRFGNVYVGGGYSGFLYVPVPGDSLSSYGGDTDFFLAKYGTSNCNALISLDVTPPPPVDIAIRVYPNPTGDELYIEHAAPGSTLKLFTILGQQVYVATTTSYKESIDTRNLATGTYILQVTDTFGNRTARTIAKQ